MYLADTSIWVEHFRRREPRLAECLSGGLIRMHPFVAGELACGNLKDRASILSDLHALPQATIATHAEVLRLLEAQGLWGRGLGWIDVHLLASALLSDCLIWTADVRVAKAATDLGIAGHPRRQ